MATFKDLAGRDWQISIDPISAAKIRAELDPDFLKGDFARGDGGNTLQRLNDDPVLLCQVIAVLTEQQRVDQGSSEEALFESLRGDAIAAAFDALVEAIATFSTPPVRKLIEAWRKQQALQEQAFDKAAAKLADPEFEAEILERIDKEVATVVGELVNQLQR